MAGCRALSPPGSSVAVTTILPGHSEPTVRKAAYRERTFPAASGLDGTYATAVPRVAGGVTLLALRSALEASWDANTARERASVTVRRRWRGVTYSSHVCRLRFSRGAASQPSLGADSASRGGEGELVDGDAYEDVDAQ